MPAIGTESYAGADRLRGTADDIAATLLPPMDDPDHSRPARHAAFRQQRRRSQAPSAHAALGIPNDTWQALPEEDLLLTGVRSFDIKALEVRNYIPSTTTLPAIPPRTEYVDLGWANLFDGAASPRSPYLVSPATASTRSAPSPTKAGFRPWSTTTGGTPRSCGSPAAPAESISAMTGPPSFACAGCWDSWCTSYTNPRPDRPDLEAQRIQ